MKTSEQILFIADQIEEILNKSEIGCPNPAIVKRLGFLAIQMSTFDVYASEKEHEIEAHSQLCYSARKHMKHPGGAPALMEEMRNHLDRIRRQANIRKEQGD